MPIDVQVKEFPEGFVIEVRQPRSWLGTVWETAVLGVVFYFFILKQFQLTPQVRLAASLIIALCYGLFDHGRKQITTTITKLEAKISRPPRRWAGLHDSVPWASVTSLSFRPEASGGEGETQPSGLYAEKEWGATCLVPYVDQQQTESLIATIEKRFPDLPFSATKPGSPLFGDNLIRLNLNHP